MARDPKAPPDLDEFDLHPDELKAQRAGRLREGNTEPSPRPQRSAAALDEFDVPLPSKRAPAQLPPKVGHVRISASDRMRAPEFDPALAPGRAPPDKKPPRGASRALADDHRTYAAKGSGPDVARWFHRLLALTFLLAFYSLGRQVDVLIGPRGLLPVSEFMEVLRLRPDGTFAQFPTLFWLDTDPSWISGGITVGMVLAVAALLGAAPRLLLIGLVPLYLSYVTVCRPFLAFQWDSMLIEAGALAIFLPRDIRSPVMHFAFRLLLFKLYFESGLAKWQSHLGDWQDGSAMLAYYETAPLPTPLAWFFHQLPVAWHHLESFAALALELIVPFFILGPRGLRRVAFVALTAFQIVNFATANYGFFIPLTLALHLFLLDDSDLRSAGATARSWLRMHARLRIAVSDWRTANMRQTGPWVAVLVLLAWGGLSAVQGVDRFVPGRATQSSVPLLLEAAELAAPFHLVNNYHLFGHITRSRVEPEVQTQTAGQWRTQHLAYTPGRADVAGRWTAPHQPRLDFRLWFYGLSYPQGTPEYVQTLLRRVCHEPAAVQDLFAKPLPKDADAVRIRFLESRYTDWAAHAETGDYWVRTEVGTTAPRRCSDAVGLGAAAHERDEREEP